VAVGRVTAALVDLHTLLDFGGPAVCVVAHLCMRLLGSKCLVMQRGYLPLFSLTML
jgi:hypothetical protein